MSPSTRSLTRESGVFVRSTAGSQALERGLQLLRSFRPGTALLTNAELAERVRLPRPTVSRLTRSLVDAGFLIYDIGRKGYRLGPVCLSLASAYRTSEPILDLVLPHMRALAEGRRVNVGLAVADQIEMVYLDSVRLSRLGLFRRLAPGSRIPIAQTALGCAYLAGMPPVVRNQLIDRLAHANGNTWPAIRMQMMNALADIHDRGYCYAFWAAGMGAVAAPLRSPEGEVYALNVSFPVRENTPNSELHDHAQLLLALKQKLTSELQRKA